MSLSTPIPLTQFGILTISGSEAKKLLQGQITIDLDKVTDSHSIHGAMCNIKGRVISSFIVSKSVNLKNDIWLIMLKDSIATSIKNLEKFVPFYQVGISDISEHWSLSGLNDLDLEKISKNKTDKNINTLRTKEWMSIRSLNGSNILISKDYHHNVNKDLDSIKEWNHLNILAHNAEVNFNNSEIYTPHELNYHLNERIDFNKGCYAGQEIVARMQYRSKSFPTLYNAISKDPNLAPNMTIINSNNKKLGSIISLNTTKEKTTALVTLKKFSENESITIKETGTKLIINK